MRRRDYIFSVRRPRLLRSHVPGSENTSVLLIAGALLAVVAWVISTRDNFDPMERDLPIALQQDRSAEITIYTRPLKLWTEPGQEIHGASVSLAPFPEQIVDGDWQPIGRVKKFQPDNLYEKINGEAEKFIKQGFVELAYLSLRSGGDGSEIAIELFDQGDLGGSLGVFAEHAAGRAIEQRDGVSFYLTTAGVIGRKDAWFFRVAGDRQSDAITAKAQALVAAFASLGENSKERADEELPPGFQLLRNRLDIEESRIQYQENNVFQFDFAQRFWFGAAGEKEQRVFVHIADDADQAARLLDLIIEEQSYEHDAMDIDGSFTLLRHQFLQSLFAIARQGRYVYGVENIGHQETVHDWMQRLDEVLVDDEA